MSDLIHRAQKAKVLAGDPSLPKWQRLCQGLPSIRQRCDWDGTPLPVRMLRFDSLAADWRL